MEIRKLALGFATFVGGAAALTGAAVALGRYQPRPRSDDAGSDEAGQGTDATPQPLDTTAADGPAPSFAQAREQTPTGDEGHAAPDLAADAAPGGRAPQAFRPDMDAPMTPAEREALRPAAGPSPTLVDAGTSLPGN